MTNDSVSAAVTVLCLSVINLQAVVAVTRCWWMVICRYCSDDVTTVMLSLSGILPVAR